MDYNIHLAHIRHTYNQIEAETHTPDGADPLTVINAYDHAVPTMLKIVELQKEALDTALEYMTTPKRANPARFIQILTELGLVNGECPAKWADEIHASPTEKDALRCDENPNFLAARCVATTKQGERCQRGYYSQFYSYCHVCNQPIASKETWQWALTYRCHIHN